MIRINHLNTLQHCCSYCYDTPLQNTAAEVMTPGNGDCQWWRENKYK